MRNGGGFRLPNWGCYTLDGRDIETMGGIKPDILVVNDLRHELEGKDPQLDRAVAKALELVRAGQNEVPRVSSLISNITHTNDHYGNIVTYSVPVWQSPL